MKIIYLGDYDPSGMDMIRDVTERPLEMLLSKALDIIGEVYDEWLDEDKNNFLSLMSDYDHDPECITQFEEGEGMQFDPYKAFVKSRFEVIPVALTREQINKYKPPPNPAKKTDPRAKKFIEEHGSKSWEVDALKPEVLNDLLENQILSLIDEDKYEKILKEEKKDIKILNGLKKHL